jgi:N-(2-amino-2-carboxyethyl)-L-glutamate synthase
VNLTGTHVEPVLDSVLDAVGRTPLVRLSRLFPEPGVEVLAKLELMNPGGSMKDRSARYIVTSGLADGSIPEGARLVESSSGNFGIAVAMAARLFGLDFTCVVDPKTTSSNLAILQQLGADVEVVTERDADGGYLQTRISRVHEILATTADTVWINQYANDRNWLAHYHGAGAELAESLVEPPTHLVAAVSTTGSILGCSRRLRERFPTMSTVAVDAVGSVIFDGPSGPREIPGIGSSRVPELHDPTEIDDVVHVDDLDSALACRRLLAKEGIFAGGSTGSVVAAIERLIPTLPRPARVVALFPDRGVRYLDLVYDDDWLAEVARRASREVGGRAERREGSER